MLGMGLAVPTASAMTELETLRERCAQQERQIHRLEDENAKLRAGKSEPAPAATRTTKAVSSPAKTDPPKATPAKAAAADGSGYTVRAGDSLDKIARHNGTTAEKLAKANGLELTSILHIGQKLAIPGKEGTHSTSSTTAAAHPTEPSTARTPPASPPVKSTTAVAAKSQAEDAPAAKSSAAAKPATATAADRKPTPDAEPAPEPAPASKTVDKKKTHTVRIEDEMTYGEFAAKHGTDTKRLNDLNGLDLSKSTVLAKGSELYVPGQP